MSRRFAVALLCLLTTAGVAGAHPRIRVARAVAVATWGNVCDGHVAIAKRPLGRDKRGRIILGESFWNLTPNGRTNCTIVLTARRHWPWTLLCPLIAHEYGHLAGQRHTRRGLMRPVIRPFWRCGPDHNHPRLKPRYYGL